MSEIARSPRTEDRASRESTSIDAAVAELYTAHAAQLIGLARTLSSGDDPEGLTHEAFARCLERWRERGIPDQPLAYLRRAVVNQAWATRRRETSALRYRRRTVAPEAPEGADGAVVADEARSALMRAVRGLPRRQRECVVLRYALGASTAETADALGISQGSVRTHLSRALTALGVELEDHR